MPADAYAKVAAQLKSCPTCGSDIQQQPTSSIFFCTAVHGHGAFIIVWSSSIRDYHVTYRPGK